MVSDDEFDTSDADSDYSGAKKRKKPPTRAARPPPKRKAPRRGRAGSESDELPSDESEYVDSEDSGPRRRAPRRGAAPSGPTRRVTRNAGAAKSYREDADEEDEAAVDEEAATRNAIREAQGFRAVRAPAQTYVPAAPVPKKKAAPPRDKSRGSSKTFRGASE